MAFGCALPSEDNAKPFRFWPAPRRIHACHSRLMMRRRLGLFFRPSWRRSSIVSSPSPSARADRLQEKAREGGEARADYDATQQATEDKTVRLKALRLAKEQADKEAAKKVVKKAAKKR